MDQETHQPEQDSKNYKTQPKSDTIYQSANTNIGITSKFDMIQKNYINLTL